MRSVVTQYLENSMPNLPSNRTKRLKCLISTGLGRLHLVQSAQHLAEAGADVELVQGWVPRRLPDAALNLAGWVVGSKHLASGMKKRQAPFLDQAKNHSSAGPEFLAYVLNKLSRHGLIESDTAAQMAWAMFGRSSRRYLNDQDIFHVRGGAGGGGAIADAHKKNIKTVVDFSIAHPAFLHNALESEFRQFDIPFAMSAENQFWKSILADYECADLVVANSHFVRQTLVDQDGNAERIAVVYLGVREDFFGLKTDYSADQQLNLLFTGGFGIRKGAQYLLPAIQHLIDGGENVRLTVVGTFSEAKPIIEAFPLGGRLSCIGFIPQNDLKAHLAAADIYVFPSLAEGCASSGMEAMAAGLPVIATKESGLPIRHGENGWLIPAKSREAIAIAIERLSKDQPLRERIGREAAKTISENFTWGHYAKNMLKVYENVLQSRESSTR